MGIIKAIGNAVGGSLADQWVEVVEADDMGGETVFTSGISVRQDDRRNVNRKGTQNYLTDGSIIHVYPNQFMFITDGGKVTDYTAEPGYFQYKNDATPSLFEGGFGGALKKTFERIKYAGVPSEKQQVFFINLQEIKGIKFGTPSPLNYFDDFYNAELFLRAYGTYSIKITNPLLFYEEVIPRNADRVDIDEINEQYRNEFLEAFQTAITQMSAEGVRVSNVPAKGMEVSRHMADVLDEEWTQRRGMEILSVGIANISYDEESKKLIVMRNKGAMLGDPSVREGYVQGSVARGMEAAGSNPGGAGQSFMGMGMGMQFGGNYAGQASQMNQEQMMRQEKAAAEERARAEAQVVQGQVTQSDRPAESSSAPGAGAEMWICPECSTQNKGNFCTNCGTKKPEAAKQKFCSNCGYNVPEGTQPNFCPECGTKFPE